MSKTVEKLQGPRYMPTELKEFDERKSRAQSIIKKYPDRVPLIIKKSDSSDKDLPDDVAKFIVPNTLTVASVIQVLREKINLSSAQAIYMSVDKKCILSGADSIGSTYDKYKADDGFLYLVYCKESVFGGGALPPNPLA
jgi:hypothetical protein